MKHWICRAGMLFCLAFLMLTGCAPDGAAEPDTGAMTTEEAAQSPYRTVLAGQAENFRIVCPDKKLEPYSSVMRSLRAVIGALDGAQPELISDFEAFYPAADREIVLGATTRTEGTPYAERIAALGSGEYELALMEEGSRIFLLFSDSEGLMAACEALLAEVYPESDTRSLFAAQLLERGVQRYSLTCHRVMMDGMALSMGGAQTFSGTTSPNAAVTAVLMHSGAEASRTESVADADGAWSLALSMPEAGEGYTLLFQVNGIDCVSYKEIAVRQLGESDARGFTVSLDGKPQNIYETKDSAFVIAEMDAKTVTVTVECDSTFTSAAVYPSSAGIKTETSGTTVTFTAPVPGKFSLELSDNTSRTLELFLYAPEENRPEPGADVLWFGPGEYSYETPIRLTSGQTVYLEAGAVLHAYFTAENAENITIAGRGIIDTYGMTEQNMITLTRCQNITLRDYTLIGPRKWMTVLLECDGAQLTDLNIIGSEINSDGIDIVGTKNVTVSGAYICANDDCIAIKSNAASNQKNVENITFTDCILWNQEYGNAIEIGYETRCESIRNLLFEEIDIIHVISGATLSIHLGDRAHVSDVTYRNIRAEDARGITVEMFIKETRYTQDTTRGSISNITIDGLHLDAKSFHGISLAGYDETHTVSGVHFSNVTLSGKVLTASKMQSLKTVYAENITWDGETIVD